MNGPTEPNEELLAVVAGALSGLHAAVSGQVVPPCYREARVALEAAGLWLAARQVSLLGFASSNDDCCEKTKKAAADMIRYQTGAGAP
ncbi:MAG: hypothetical protein NVS3B1_29430 [Marmoricola sp.]